MIFYFTPSAGRLNLENREKFKRFLAGLPEKRMKMTVKEDKLTRSDKQRRYQWGVVYKYLSEETGYTPEEVHELMGKRFLQYHKGMESFTTSTTRLNTKEMEEYLENVRRFAAAELGCWIPLPNESDFPY